MPEAATQPAPPANRSLASADTVLRGVPALAKLPPFVQYALVMLLTAFGGYMAGPSAADAEERSRVVIEKLESLERGVRAIDRRVIKIEAMREAERGGDG